MAHQWIRLCKPAKVEKKSKFDHFSIKLDRDCSVIYAGQRLNGFVLVSLNQSISCQNIKLFLKGRALTKWTMKRNFGGDRRRITYRGEEKYIDDELMLYSGAAGGGKLISGDHKFHFEFVVPRECPSSFEGDYGCVRYLLKAVIDEPKEFDHEVERLFTVIEQFDLNLDPTAAECVEETKVRTLRTFLFKSSELSCTAVLPRRGFVSGQSLGLSLQVETTSVVVQCVNILVNQTIVFTAQRMSLDQERTTKETVLSVSHDDVIPGNSSQNLDFSSIRIPSIPPSLVNCKIIAISYYLVIEVIPAGLHKQLKLKVPIIIGTIPLRSTFGRIIRNTNFCNADAPRQPSVTEPSTSLEDNPPAYQQLYPDLPPPSYERCVIFVKDDQEVCENGSEDSGDGEDSVGDPEDHYSKIDFLPLYPVYAFQQL